MEIRKRLASESETLAFGRKLGKKLLRTRRRRGAIVLTLTGELGTGKTTMIRGLARGFDIKEKITSPTFLLIRAYPLKNRRTFYHIDCYRLARPRDLDHLGLRDLISHPDHIVAIEWAEKIKPILPKRALKISLRDGKTPRERIVTVRGRYL